MSKIIGYKAFDEKFQCNPTGSNPFQYEVGKTYTTDNATICQQGFHFCKKPFDVFNYYVFCLSRFGLVEADSKNTKSKRDKSATTEITIVKELPLYKFIEECKSYMKRNKRSNKNYIVSDKSDFDIMPIISGSYIVSGGRYNNIASSKSSTTIFATGYGTEIAVSNNAAKIGVVGNYIKVASTSSSAQIIIDGRNTHCATVGDWTRVCSTGKNSAIAAIGEYSKVKGKIGTWFTLAEYNIANECIFMKAFYIDGKKIKEDIFYYLKNKKLIKYVD